ncbi:MAG: class II aldolase/adducin family protein, partial [Vicinamibacteria bacterium]
SGSDELAKRVLEALGPRMAVILGNHGVFCCGKSLDRAHKNAILLEHAARIYVYSLMAGKATLLPAEVIEMEKEMFQFVKEM